MSEATKPCSCCGAVKPLTDFQARRASKDGLTASCKACLKVRDAARYHGEKDARAKLHKAYMQTPAGKAAHSKAGAAYRAVHPERAAAHVALNNAVRDGRVQPWPVCAVPECDRKPEAHHPDYGAPLAVVWLCSAHHKQAHALTRN